MGEQSKTIGSDQKAHKHKSCKNAHPSRKSAFGKEYLVFFVEPSPFVLIPPELFKLFCLRQFIVYLIHHTESRNRRNNCADEPARHGQNTDDDSRSHLSHEHGVYHCLGYVSSSRVLISRLHGNWLLLPCTGQHTSPMLRVVYLPRS